MQWRASMISGRCRGTVPSTVPACSPLCMRRVEHCGGVGTLSTSTPSQSALSQLRDRRPIIVHVFQNLGAHGQIDRTRRRRDCVQRRPETPDPRVLGAAQPRKVSSSVFTSPAQDEDQRVRRGLRRHRRSILAARRCARQRVAGVVTGPAPARSDGLRRASRRQSLTPGARSTARAMARLRSSVRSCCAIHSVKARFAIADTRLGVEPRLTAHLRQPMTLFERPGQDRGEAHRSNVVQPPSPSRRCGSTPPRL